MTASNSIWKLNHWLNCVPQNCYNILQLTTIIHTSDRRIILRDVKIAVSSLDRLVLLDVYMHQCLRLCAVYFSRSAFHNDSLSRLPSCVWLHDECMRDLATIVHTAFLWRLLLVDHNSDQLTVHRRRLFFFFFLGQRTNSLTFRLFPFLLSPSLSSHLPLRRRPLNTAMGLGSAVSSPSRVWGKAPADKRFGAYMSQKEQQFFCGFSYE